MQLDPLAQSRKVYAETDRTYLFPTLVRHQGTVIAFSMDDSRRIYYSVMDLSPDPGAQQNGAASKTNDAEAWSGLPEFLIFPPEIAVVGFSAVGQAAMPVFRRSDSPKAEPTGAVLPIGDRARVADFDYFRSTTAHLTAMARFEALSDGTFVYLFRQSHDDTTLLVDRFLLVGRKLESKLEVRFQRSRRRGVPQNKKDTLGARDLDGNPFVEPTQKLGFIRDLTEGRFSSLLVPTHVAGVQRWQIFAENSATGRMDSYNIERSEDGLFNTRGTVSLAERKGGGESALSFAKAAGEPEPGSDPFTTVTLDQPVLLGSSFTIEGWINPAEEGANDQVLLSDTNQALVRLLNRTQIVIGGKAAGNLTVGEWTHIAIVGQAGSIRVFTGARLQEPETLSDPEPDFRPSVIGRIGGSAVKFPPRLDVLDVPGSEEPPVDGFVGMLDEFRIWDRARSHEELKRDKDHRLTGLEPGLTTYLRFDEGRGKRAFDQTRGGAHGTIADPANRSDAALWPLSGALLGESPGIERHSFGFEGRTFHSAPSALLYFQQSTEIRSGYNSEPKPLKQNGRIMVAVATRATAADPKPFIAVLDFGVSASGRIPKTPDVVPLTLVTPGTGGLPTSASVNERLDEIADLEAQRRLLAAQVASLENPPPDLARAIAAAKLGEAVNPATVDVNGLIAFVGQFIGTPPSPEVLVLNQPEFAVLLQAVGAVVDAAGALAKALIGNGPLTIEQGRAGLRSAVDSLAVLRGNLEASRAQISSARESRIAALAEITGRLANLTNAATNGVAAEMHQVHVDASGLSITGGLLNFAFTNDTPLLFDSATGKLALYFRGSDNQFFVTYYETFTSRAKCNLGSLECLARATERELDRLTMEVTDAANGFCTVTITGAGITEAWRRVPTDPQRFRDVLNGTASRRTKVGEGSFSANGAALNMATLTREIEAGSLLVAGNLKVTARNRVSAGDPRIELTASPRSTVPPEPLPVFLLTYDYSQAVSSLPAADLENGSSLIFAAAPTGTTPIQNVAVTAGSTINSKWVAVAPGATLEFDGKTQLATLQDTARLNALNAQDDLSLECWVRPARIQEKTAVLLEHPDYSLALKPARLESALVLKDSFVEVAFPTGLPIGQVGEFTIESWVRLSTLNESAVLLRMSGLNFTMFLAVDGSVSATYNGTSFASTVKLTDLVFHHVAFAVKVTPGTTATTATLYVDGSAHATSAVTAVPRVATVQTLLAGAGDVAVRRFFSGEIDEVRLWATGRTRQQILLDMHRRLAGNETGLRGCWTFAGGVAADLSRFRHPARIDSKSIQTSASPLGGFQVAATVRSQSAIVSEVLPFGNWTHVAAAYQRGYAVQFDGKDEHLDCGEGASLNIPGDITIEVFAELKELNRRQMILRKGRFDDEDSTQKPPYALHVNENNQLTFSFMDVQGNVHSFSGSTALSQGFHHLAVIRKRTSEPDSNKETASTRTVFDAITLLIDGNDAGVAPGTLDVFGVLPNKHRFEGLRVGGTPEASGGGVKKDGSIRQPEQVATSSRALTIASAGKLGNLLIDGWNGSISEVRIWNHARTPEEVKTRRPLRDDQSGLAGWWRFRERDGGRVKDNTSNGNHATLKGGRWTLSTDPLGGAMTVLVNGVPTVFALEKSPATAPASYAVGRDLHGELEEMRIWRTARTPEQIQDNMFGRVRDEIKDLLAWYTFDPSLSSPGIVVDGSLGLNDLRPVSASFVLSTAPIGEDGPYVRNALAGIRSPFSGFIESAPAVHEYADAQLDSHGDVIGVFKRVYGYVLDRKWNLITGYKVGDLATEWVGQVQFNPELLGYIEGAPPVPSENLTSGSDDAIGDLDDYSGASCIKLVDAEDKTYTFEASRDAGVKLKVDLALEFGATARVDAVTAPLGFGINTQIVDTTVAGGPRIALETAHGFLDEASLAFGVSTAKATSLELRGHFGTGSEVGASNIPRLFLPDNIGQALVKSETADVFALRLRHNGALIAYQFRPNPDIPKDVNILSFQINPVYTTQGTLDGKVGSQSHLNFPGALERSSDSSYFKPIEAFKIKAEIDKKAADLQTLYDQYAARQNAHLSRFAAGSLADRYRPLQAGKAKRSLVNTYVWTADGGLYAETQQSSDTFLESTGGSFEFTGGIGVDFSADLEIGPVEFNLALNVLLSGYYKLEETKSVESKNSYSLEVDVEKVERDIMKRDAAGNFIRRNGRVQRLPGKVDAYRFMTFRLEPSSDNFETFYNKVVDPVWLQTNDPNAVALRGARQAGKKPPCWRVLHRVTFVSRVLGEVAGDGDAPALVQTMRQLDIDSNFELIKQFEPYVIDLLHDLNAFTRAIEARINEALPALSVHRQDITSFLMDHYGLSTLLVAGQGHDAAFGEASFLEQSVNAPPAVAILGDELRIAVLEGSSCEVNLAAQVTDDRLTADAVFLTWQGQEKVAFSDIHANNPRAIFTKRGRFQVTVTADDGKLTGKDSVTVLVNEPPRVAIATPGEPVRDHDTWTLDLKAALLDDGRADTTPESGQVTLEWQPGVGFSFSEPSQLETKVTFIAPGIYTLRVIATNGAAVSTPAEVSVSIASRVFLDLQTFYTFERGEGSLIEDVAGTKNPIDLTCDLGKAEWVPGGLRLTGTAAIQPSSASPLSIAIREKSEFTVEAWIESTSLDREGLISLVSLGTGDRLFLSLAQLGSVCVAAVGSTATEPNGSGQALTGATLTSGNLAHVVATFGESRLRIFVDGREVGRRSVDGDLSAWDPFLPDARLHLAPDGWTGVIRLVAIYNRALTSTEVAQNFSFGPDVDLAPIVDAGEDINVQFTGTLSSGETVADTTVTLRGRIAHDRPPADGASILWEFISGPVRVSPVPQNSLNPVVTLSQKGQYVFSLTATDGRRQGSDQVAVTVHRLPVTRAADILTVSLETAPRVFDLEVEILDSGSGVDASPSVKWLQISGPPATVTGADQLVAQASVNERGSYIFSVEVSNGQMSITRFTTVVVLTRPVVAIEGAPAMLTLPAFGLASAAGVGGGASPVEQGSVVDLRGVVSDSGGAAANALVFAWSSSPPAQFSAPNAAETRVTLKETGVYTIQLAVSNGELENTASSTIAANRPPVVDAGPDIQLTGVPVVRLNGFFADDGMGSHLVNTLWTATGPGEVAFDNASATVTRARFFAAGEYVLSLTADDGNAIRSDSTKAKVVGVRHTDDLVSFFPIDEPSGSDLRDRVNAAAPVLTFTPATAFERLPGGGLRISRPAPIGIVSAIASITAQSPNAAFFEAIRGRREFSIEMWVAPARTDFNDATLLSLANAPSGLGAPPPKLDIALIQKATSIVLRLRQTSGLSPVEISTPLGTLTTEMTQVFCTARSDGDTVAVTLFLNGRQVVAANLPSRIEEFEDFRLAVANDLASGSPWTGVLSSLALFSRALDGDTVLQNFVAGPR